MNFGIWAPKKRQNGKSQLEGQLRKESRKIKKKKIHL
jgi:hypothetical protein